ncbi:hypothetical protein H5410_031828 [Solanum commersonii]|uniref:Uncharacterized protein n=1 Tax=Solanum commersonii TaxID=4109 RepID=A0A9J5YJC4_SOLCO|nr:hypothetical protein H5410_031828 [Solanum commersonii]
MVAHSNLIACRVCDKVFPSFPVSKTTHFKLNSKQGQSQFASRANDNAIFHSTIEESHSRSQVYKDRELNLVGFTKLLIKKLDKPFIFENVKADEDQNVDLELKL